MALKFPTARLLMQELLFAERLSGAQAIARGAFLLGLIPAVAASEVMAEVNEDHCHCMKTAKNVVKKHFESRPDHAATSANVEEIWLAIEKYFCNCARHIAARHTCTHDHTTESSCHKHAPILIDLMLQQLMRYP